MNGNMNKSQSGIKWPVAKKPDGGYVKIIDANSGGYYLCPECEGRFVARKGDVVRWHFAHYPGVLCTGEGSRHTIAKHYIAIILSESPHVSLRCPCSLELPTKPYKIKFTDIKVEDTVLDYRIDVTCKRKGQLICIEVIDTNPTVIDKKEALKDMLLEVAINDLNDDDIFSGEKIKERLEHELGQYFKSFVTTKHYFIHTWHGSCWQCHKDRGIVQLCNGVNPAGMWTQNFPPKLLTTMRKYAKLEWRTTSIVKEGYIANVCPHCGAVQGDFPLIDELMDILSSGNADKVETIIFLGE